MKIDKKAKKALIFLLTFVGLLIVFYGVLDLTRDNIFMYYIYATAHVSALLMKIFGVSAITSNGVVSDGSFSLYLAFGCEGSEPIMIFAAATLAFPAKWRDKIIGVIGGTIILYVLNLVRILMLFFIGKHYPDSFRAYHGEIFPVIFIFLAILVWILWINRLKKAPVPKV